MSSPINAESRGLAIYPINGKVPLIVVSLLRAVCRVMYLSNSPYRSIFLSCLNLLVRRCLLAAMFFVLTFCAVYLFCLREYLDGAFRCSLDFLVGNEWISVSPLVFRFSCRLRCCMFVLSLLKGGQTPLVCLLFGATLKGGTQQSSDQERKRS